MPGEPDFLSIRFAQSIILEQVAIIALLYEKRFKINVSNIYYINYFRIAVTIVFRREIWTFKNFKVF